MEMRFGHSAILPRIFEIRLESKRDAWAACQSLSAAGPAPDRILGIKSKCVGGVRAVFYRNQQRILTGFRYLPDIPHVLEETTA